MLNRLPPANRPSDARGRRDVTAPPPAARQGGAFTLDQAFAVGFTARQVARRCALGRWRRLTATVLTAEPGPTSELTRAWCAALMWPEAVVCRRSAGHLWGFPMPDDGRCHVVAGHGRHAPGFAVHIVRPPDQDVVDLDGLPVTSPRRTVLDCLATLPTGDGLDLFAWVSTRHVISRADVIEERERRRGRPGVRRLTDLLEVTATGAVSKAEFELHGLLAAAGVTGWRANAAITVGGRVLAVVDLLFARQRLVVEVDGLRSHSDRPAFINDRRRHNRLVAAGYTVLRFTWWDLTERPDEVISTIQSALDRSAAPPRRSY